MIGSWESHGILLYSTVRLVVSVDRDKEVMGGQYLCGSYVVLNFDLIWAIGGKGSTTDSF